MSRWRAPFPLKCGVFQSGQLSGLCPSWHGQSAWQASCPGHTCVWGLCLPPQSWMAPWPFVPRMFSACRPVGFRGFRGPPHHPQQEGCGPSAKPGEGLGAFQCVLPGVASLVLKSGEQLFPPDVVKGTSRRPLLPSLLPVLIPTGPLPVWPEMALFLITSRMAGLGHFVLKGLLFSVCHSWEKRLLSLGMCLPPRKCVQPPLGAPNHSRVHCPWEPQSGPERR